MKSRPLSRSALLLLLAAPLACAPPAITDLEPVELAAPAPDVAALRALNADLLDAWDRHARAAESARASIAAQADSIAADRAAAFAAFADAHPWTARTLVLPEELAVAIAADLPSASADLEQHGAWQGSVDVEVADADEEEEHHRTRVRFDAVQAAGGTRAFELVTVLADAPALESGAWASVEGVRIGSVVLADAIEVVEPAAYLPDECTPLGEQRTAVLLVTFPGVDPPKPPDFYRTAFFADEGLSLDTFWQDASYGRAWATGDVHGWYTLDRTYSCAEYHDMRDAAIAAADADVDFRDVERVFVVFPRVGPCSWAGKGTIGCTNRQSPGDGAFRASVSWMRTDQMNSRVQAVKLALHEGGHNLGMSHASTRDFGVDALGPIGDAGTLKEYGDKFSTMGGWNFGHYAAPHKKKLGWLDAGTHVAVATTAGGTFTLSPFETLSNAPRTVRIPRGTGAKRPSLWMEWRRPIGAYDVTLPAQVFSGALVHYADATTKSKTHLLDFTPGTGSWLDPALATGASWADPYSNLRLAVHQDTSAGLRVTVEYAEPACILAHPALAVDAPNPAVPAGGTAAITVQLDNRDDGPCADAAFELTAELPEGWSADWTDAAPVLAPGAGTGVLLRVHVPADAAAGTLPLAVRAVRGATAAAVASHVTVDPR